MGKYRLLLVLTVAFLMGTAHGEPAATDANILRTRTVKLEVGPLERFDPGATCGRSVAFKLFDEVRVTGQLEDVEHFGADGLTARGVLHGADEGGSFSLTLEGTNLTGAISTPVLGNYEVATLEDGTYQLRELGAPVLATSSAVAEEACSPGFSLQDCGFELADLSQAWGEGATGPLGSMIYTATEGEWNATRYGQHALRFAARDTDDVWAVGQTVTAESAGDFLISLRLRLTEVPTTGSVSVSVGEQIHNIALSELELADDHYDFTFPVSFTAENLTQTLSIGNPSLNGGDVLIDNVHFDFPIVDGGEGEGDGEGEGVDLGIQTTDQDGNNVISLTELLRVIQFFNSDGLHCAETSGASEDGFVPGPGAKQSCLPHSNDYQPQDWDISLTELLRSIQFFNVGGYTHCPDANTEDGFCVGPPVG